MLSGLCHPVSAPDKLSLPVSGDGGKVSGDKTDEVLGDLEADLELVLVGGRVEYESCQLPDVGLGRGRVVEKELWWEELDWAS